MSTFIALAFVKVILTNFSRKFDHIIHIFPISKKKDGDKMMDISLGPKYILIFKMPSFSDPCSKCSRRLQPFCGGDSSVKWKVKSSQRKLVENSGFSNGD